METLNYAILILPKERMFLKPFIATILNDDNFKKCKLDIIRLVKAYVSTPPLDYHFTHGLNENEIKIPLTKDDIKRYDYSYFLSHNSCEVIAKTIDNWARDMYLATLKNYSGIFDLKNITYTFLEKMNIPFEKYDMYIKFYQRERKKNEPSFFKEITTALLRPTSFNCPVLSYSVLFCPFLSFIV